MDELYTNYYDQINAQQQANNAWSAEQAQKAMDYQTQMSNTAHQREVADLKAAGLNPVLSAGGTGATTGSGIAASAGNENVSALYGLVKHALDANMKQAEMMAETARSAGKGPVDDSFDVNNLISGAGLGLLSGITSNSPKSLSEEYPLSDTEQRIVDGVRRVVVGGLARVLHITRKEADEMVAPYFDNVAGVRDNGLNILLQRSGLLEPGKSPAQLRREFYGSPSVTGSKGNRGFLGSSSDNKVRGNSTRFKKQSQHVK